MQQHKRIALATGAQWLPLNADEQLLVEALRKQGLTPTTCVWNDPAVAWQAFDAVLIRSIWDYFQRFGEYLDWLQRLEALGVPTLNPIPVLRWNSDKRYLLELAAAGVAIPPSRVLRGAELAGQLRSGTAELVVKPTVSGGAWLTARGRPGDPGFDATIGGLPAQLEFLVQPFLPEITSAGEWSLLYFGHGQLEFSHAVLKRPATGDYRVQSQFGGLTETLSPPPEVRAAADKALAATRALGHGPLSYARVDGLMSEGRFLLMEIELIEPHLFLSMRPGAAEQMAQAVVKGLVR